MGTMRQKIEDERKKMNQLAEKYGLSDDRVITKSLELDRLLNQYHREKPKDEHISCFPDCVEK